MTGEAIAGLVTVATATTTAITTIIIALIQRPMSKAIGPLNGEGNVMDQLKEMKNTFNDLSLVVSNHIHEDSIIQTRILDHMSRREEKDNGET